MKKTILKNNLKIKISEIYRTPSELEKTLGLWIDRIGHNQEMEHTFPEEMRILNLYASVAVIEGHGVFESTLTKRLEINSGDVIMLFPDVPSRYGSISGWRTEWIVWQGHDADNMIQAGYFSPDNPIISNGANLVHNASLKAQKLMISEGAQAALERKLVIQEMLLNLYKNRYRKNIYQDKIIRQAVNFISENINRSLSVKDIAARFHLSEVHFRRIFKAGTGFSPKDYILRLKISEAKRLLSEGMTAKEIADYLEFCDEFHLRNAFRRITGMALGQFV